MLCLLPWLALPWSCAVCRIRACTPVSIILSSHRAEELRNIYQEDIHYFVQHGSSLLKKLYKTRPASHSSEQVSFPRGARLCLIPVSFGFWSDVFGSGELRLFCFDCGVWLGGCVLIRPLLTCVMCIVFFFRLFLVFSFFFLVISLSCTYSSPFRFHVRVALVLGLFLFPFFFEP